MGIVVRKSPDRAYRFPIFLGAVLGTMLLLGALLPSSHSQADSRSLPEIKLHLGKKALIKIQTKRRAAMKAGLLISSQEDWVKGEMAEGKEKFKVKVRLKGDWTDHLKGGKWSFRVQVKDSAAFHGMKVFSLQNPRTRGFLNEWHLHQVLLQENVLTTRYEFIRLKLNGGDVGIYAMEEHFQKELVESQRQREGVLLKFSEDGMWDLRRLALQEPDFRYETEPFYEAAEVAPFQWKKIKRRPRLRRDFSIGHLLMNQYKHGLRPTKELFELNAVARQYALIDLFDGHHSLIWHNRRFYYNPMTCLLQPVVFDAFSGDEAGEYLHGPFTGHGCNGKTWYDGRMDLLGTRFFASEEFVRAYYQGLFKFSSPEYLQAIEEQFGGRLKFLEDAFQSEFLFYDFEEEALQAHADRIRKALVVERDKVVWDSSGGSICLQNNNAVPVDVLGWENGGEVSWQAPHLLNAYDGRNPAASVELKTWQEKVLLAIPGGDTLRLSPQFN